MREELLHFAYQYKLFDDATFYNVEEANIVHVGRHNFDAGPDFTGAKLKTNQALWVGNVEIHIKSSDWKLHKHHLDKAYNNVILHVVMNHDCDVYTESGRLLPVLEVKITEKVAEKYEEFIKQKHKIACADDIASVDAFKVQMWLNKVLVERLNKKTTHIKRWLDANINDWETVFYYSLAKGFGFNVNSEAFEHLVQAVPLKVVYKHNNNPFQIEAIFMGQAGFLDDEDEKDNYYKDLQKEYNFLRHKFNLYPIERHEWKFLRLRPSNFPTIRISQFANLMCKYNSLFAKVLEAENINDLQKIFNIKASEYWETHYTFGKLSDKKSKTLGKQSVNLILINSVIPMLFNYGQYTDNEEIKDKAIRFLENIKPEKNSIINQWTKIGIKSKSSFETQALLEQKKSYCDVNKCLKCGIGIEILKKQE